MDLKEIFGSARAEHEPDHPTPAARPISTVEDDVMLTGWDEQMDANEGAAAGVDRAFMKPVSREQLFEMFESEGSRVREFARETACPRS